MQDEQTVATETQDLADDWGDEPRKSAERLEAEERLSALYPEEEQSPEPEPEQAEPRGAEPVSGKLFQKSELREPEADDDDAIFTGEDLKLATLVEPEMAAFQRDLAAFAQLKAIGPEKLANGDKAQAAAVRVQLRKAEAELRQRYETLQAATTQLAGKVQQRQVRKAERRLEAERQKLAERVPDLDKVALRSYLEARGFTKDEIGMAADARLIEMAEKARRYDEMNQQRQPRKLKVPQGGRKPRKQETHEVPADETVNELRHRLRGDDPVITLYGRQTRKAQSARRPKIDDPVEILYGRG